jgi:hypothetical protein
VIWKRGYRKIETVRRKFGRVMKTVRELDAETEEEERRREREIKTNRER